LHPQVDAKPASLQVFPLPQSPPIVFKELAHPVRVEIQKSDVGTSGGGVVVGGVVVEGVVVGGGVVGGGGTTQTHLLADTEKVQTSFLFEHPPKEQVGFVFSVHLLVVHVGEPFTHKQLSPLL